MPDQDTPAVSNPNQRKLIAIALFGIVVLLLLLWWLLRGPAEVTWQETTVPYDPECATDCEAVALVAPGHRGQAELLMANPNVDDPIAQWGDCIDTFTTCMDRDRDSAACMTASSCPAECKDAYGSGLSDTEGLEAELTLFQSMFLEAGAYCRPIEEAGR